MQAQMIDFKSLIIEGKSYQDQLKLLNTMNKKLDDMDKNIKKQVRRFQKNNK